MWEQCKIDESLGIFHLMQLQGSGTLKWLKRAFDIEDIKEYKFDEIHTILRLVLTPPTAPEQP